MDLVEKKVPEAAVFIVISGSLAFKSFKRFSEGKKIFSLFSFNL